MGDGPRLAQEVPTDPVQGTSEISAVPTRRDSPSLVWERAEEYFHENFIENDFGHVCDICDRSWFMKDVGRVSEKMVDLLAAEFPDENTKDFIENFS